ncbi:hypothetical protein MKW98_009741 [Papaver atlanticum]|uniref:Uncharacterized protein n=1 Tax=Papaver atlanticum TaxID=357466 RepID=A0AAD4SV67_9MAGN|nr:hypothetical protein MKW98_009741 [Papaver atlanticum]
MMMLSRLSDQFSITAFTSMEQIRPNGNDNTYKTSKILKDFPVVAEAEVRSLASLYSVVGRSADALALYFGEDPARCPFEQDPASENPVSEKTGGLSGKPLFVLATNVLIYMCLLIRARIEEDSVQCMSMVESKCRAGIHKELSPGSRSSACFAASGPADCLSFSTTADASELATSSLVKIYLNSRMPRQLNYSFPMLDGIWRSARDLEECERFTPAYLSSSGCCWGSLN